MMTKRHIVQTRIFVFIVLLGNKDVDRLTDEKEVTNNKILRIDAVSITCEHCPRKRAYKRTITQFLFFTDNLLRSVVI